MPEYLEDVRAEADGVLDISALERFREAASTERLERFGDGDTSGPRDDFASIVAQLIQGLVAEIGVGMPAAMVMPEEAAAALFGSKDARDVGPMGWGYVIADLATLILSDPFGEIPTTE